MFITGEEKCDYSRFTRSLAKTRKKNTRKNNKNDFELDGVIEMRNLIVAQNRRSVEALSLCTPFILRHRGNCCRDRALQQSTNFNTPGMYIHAPQITIHGKNNHSNVEDKYDTRMY